MTTDPCATRTGGEDHLQDRHPRTTARQLVTDTIAERGAASLHIELIDGVITVIHGSADVTLAQWTARRGDWDALWDTIHRLQHQETP